MIIPVTSQFTSYVRFPFFPAGSQLKNSNLKEATHEAPNRKHLATPNQARSQGALSKAFASAIGDFHFRTTGVERPDAGERERDSGAD